MTTMAAVQGQVWTEASPMVRGGMSSVVLLGTVAVWAVIGFVAYLVIRLAVRHALQDVAPSSDAERRPAHVDTE